MPSVLIITADHPKDRPEITLTCEAGPSLDQALSQDLRARFHQAFAVPTRVVINCAGTETVDPVGAALLWQLAREWERAFALSLVLTHLSLELRHRLRAHPLRHYISGGEEIFQDPFFSPLPSSR